MAELQLQEMVTLDSTDVYKKRSRLKVNLRQKKRRLRKKSPFMEGRAQLPAKEVQEGRRIASVRIHVERAIGRMKNFVILQGTFPISLVSLIKLCMCVCAFLTNFMPALFLLRKILRMRMLIITSKVFQVILNMMK